VRIFRRALFGGASLSPVPRLHPGEGLILRILALDASLASSGYALIEQVAAPADALHSARLIEAGEVQQSYSGAKGYLHMARKVALTLDALPPGPVDLLVLEKQFMSPKAQKDIGIVLGTSAGIWIGLVAGSYCVPSLILIVTAMEWGSVFHLPAKREGRKARAMLLAHTFDPSVEWGEDSADALLIGLWAAAKFPTLEAAKAWQSAPTATTRMKRAKKPQLSFLPPKSRP
jgi:hypothetical protein